MASATATVETLTAEVRTLVVGSRQVTMSVAKQLDVVGELPTIFGRVNMPTVGQHPIIGADRSGQLALGLFSSPVERPDGDFPGWWTREWKAWAVASEAAYRDLPLIVLAGLR